MKRYFIRGFVGLIVCVFLLACETVPITGRRTLNLVPQSQLNSMAKSQYDQFLEQNQLSDNTAASQMVKRVGLRLQRSVEGYYAARGMQDLLSGYSWEFNLIESDEKNAWCMPGGKVVVYEGILSIAEDEEGLAVVMGHEIAHAIAEHGNERMSTALIAQLGGAALSTAIEEQPESTKKWFLAAYGAGTQVGVLLPYSRRQEAEADHLGLIFMARAGYDPRAAIPFWKRMAKEGGGGATPEFLSTHPTSQSRVENIEEIMPTALKHYRQAVGQAGTQ
ncbi:MAG: M48 family metallopeptidase [Candidatus Sumerlaeota bacterium]